MSTMLVFDHDMRSWPIDVDEIERPSDFLSWLLFLRRGDSFPAGPTAVKVVAIRDWIRGDDNGQDFPASERIAALERIAAQVRDRSVAP